LKRLHCHLVAAVLEKMKMLNIELIAADFDVQDFPQGTRATGLMEHNMDRLWRQGRPPMSPMDAVSTSRTCSMIEALLCILIMICGGGLLRVTDTERCKVTGANRSIVKNGDGLAFGYAAGFKSSGTSGEARMREQLVALKQLSSAASRLLASYLILGKPLAIKSASDLYGSKGAAVHGSSLLARNGKDALEVLHHFLFHSSRVTPHTSHASDLQRPLVPSSYQFLIHRTCQHVGEVRTPWLRGHGA
jgi:hypothetical protein